MRSGEFLVAVETSFSATHALRLADGSVEPVHGHDWAVRAEFRRGTLDDSGMVVDFHAAQSVLQKIASQYHHRHLNEHEDFEGRNPTAEWVACRILERLHRAGLDSASRVLVTEAPGCVGGFEVGDQ